MNQSLFLHIAERLEGLLGKLPASLQKPIFHELIPLKELFLQQRAPRFVLTGTSSVPAQEIVAALFSSAGLSDMRDVLTELYRWQEIEIGALGKIMLLDARGADDSASDLVRDELNLQAGDVFVHLQESGTKLAGRSREQDFLVGLLRQNGGAKIVAIAWEKRSRRLRPKEDSSEPGGTNSNCAAKLESELASHPECSGRVIKVFELRAEADGAMRDRFSRELMVLLSAELPNEARVEMIRISRDREAQTRIAQVLVKSASAMCTAIGAQPIPLADLPILTTLQLVMISGIMHISGREKSLRAATEFSAALGANVGAGMLLREGTRALLKFFPGWGNVVCGMVAGAGTYAIGKSATAYFIEGVSLKDARRTYLASRKKPIRQKLPAQSGDPISSNRRD